MNLLLNLYIEFQLNRKYHGLDVFSRIWAKYARHLRQSLNSSHTKNPLGDFAKKGLGICYFLCLLNTYCTFRCSIQFVLPRTLFPTCFCGETINCSRTLSSGKSVLNCGTRLLRNGPGRPGPGTRKCVQPNPARARPRLGLLGWPGPVQCSSAVF